MNFTINFKNIQQKTQDIFPSYKFIKLIQKYKTYKYVSLFKDKNDNNVIIKTISPIETGKKELHYLKKVQDFNFCSQIIEYKEHQDDDYFSIVLKYIQGIELFYLIKYYDFDVIYLFTNLVKHTFKINNIGIVHSDLKPSNILVDPNNIEQLYIIDFGCSIDINSQHKIASTSMYGPHELSKYHVKNQKTDIYSLGIILYTMLSKTCPEFDKNNVIILDNISIKYHKLILHMTKYEITQRATYQDIFYYLELLLII